MSEWTNNPTETGAYWFQFAGAEPDIVWVHQGRVWSPIGSSTVKQDVSFGAMFYGPLEKPPAMPKPIDADSCMDAVRAMCKGQR